MSPLLRQKISAVRARRTCISAGTGLTMGITLFLGILTVEALADWWINFPLLWRAILLAANVALVLYAIADFALLPILRGADDETLALAIERMVPQFSSRLIAAVQFSRPDSVTVGESNALVCAMVAQTEQFASGVNFLPVIKADLFKRWGTLAIVVVTIATGLFAYGGESSRILLRRQFLAQEELPAKTRVLVLSGSFLVPQGECATLTAHAEGWLPESGTAEIVYTSGRTQTVSLQRDKDQRDLYAGGIDAVQESFSYRIRIYDGISESFSVATEARPTVLSLNCLQIYPKYTDLPPAPHQPTDLTLLAGSRLRLTVLVNKPLQRRDEPQPPPATAASLPTVANRVQLVAHDGTLPLNPVGLLPDANDDRKWSAEFALPENISGFTIHLTDEHGLESMNPPFYAIDLIPDRPPAVRLTAPDRREVLVTTEATCTVGFVAEDDYGVASLSLHYKIDEEPEHAIPLSVNVGDRQIRGYYPWQITKLTPPPDKPSLEGCVIEFDLEARDSNNVSGPGITASEHYQLRVVSKDDKQAELVARMAESFSAIHDVSEKQENAAAELDSLITESPALTQPSFTQPNR